MMQLGGSIVNAIRKKLEGQIEAHKINITVLLENQVGVAEHSDITKTIEDELDIIASCEDKIAVLNKHFNDYKED
tara:strand:- start:731 stop:955 length:225 start_codon:yes stop_codon:yes gene_type:complete